MTKHAINRILLSGCWLAWATLCGCSASIDPHKALADANATNIQRLANLYTTYQTRNAWQGPAEQEQFKAFIRHYNPKKLARVGVDPNSIDALFISERDGKPLKIRYGVPGSAMGSSEAVVFESVGLNGKRLVGFLDMKQQEVDQTRYEKLWNGAEPVAQTTRDSLRN